MGKQASSCFSLPLTSVSPLLLLLCLLLLCCCPVCCQYANTGDFGSSSNTNPGTISNNYSPTKSLDMEAVTVCSNTGAYDVSSTDIVDVFARPPQIDHSTRDKCLVELRAPEGRRLVVYVMDVAIFDHGTTIKFFDDRGSMIIPRFQLNSVSAPDQKWTSQYNRLVIALIKLSTAANNYRYKLAVTTDDGPPLEFGRDQGSYYQEPQMLSTEAIVGVSVAAAIVFFGLLGLAIYCCVHLSREKAAEKADSKVEASTVYSSGVSQVYFPTHTERYQKSKTYSEESSVQHNVFKATPEAYNPPPAPKSGSMRKDKQGLANKAFEGQEEKKTSKAYEAGRPSREKNGAIPDARRDTVGKSSTRGSHSPTRSTPPRVVDSTDKGPRKSREPEEPYSGNKGHHDTFARGTASRTSTRGRSRSERRVSENGAYEPVEYGRNEMDRLPRDRNRNSMREGRSGSARASTRRRGDDQASRDTSRDYSTRDYGDYYGPSSRERSSRDRAKRSQSASSRRDSSRRQNGGSRTRSAGRDSTRSHGRRSSRRDRDDYYSDDFYDDYYDDYRPSRRHSRSRSRHTYEDYDDYEDSRRGGRGGRRRERSPSADRRGRQYSYA